MVVCSMVEARLWYGDTTIILQNRILIKVFRGNPVAQNHKFVLKIVFTSPNYSIKTELLLEYIKYILRVFNM